MVRANLLKLICNQDASASTVWYPIPAEEVHRARGTRVWEIDESVFSRYHASAWREVPEFSSPSLA